MNLRQYLKHLWVWFLTFPRWSANEHTTVGPAGGGVYHCLLCDYVEVDEEEVEHRCGLCGDVLEAVRPGKYQCPTCEGEEVRP